MKKRLLSLIFVVAILFSVLPANIAFAEDYMMADMNFDGLSSLPSGWKTQNGASAVVAGDKVTVSGESGGRLRFDNPFVKKNIVTTVEYRIRPYGDIFVWMVNPSNSGINPTLIRFSGNKVQSIDKRWSSSNETAKDLVAFTPGNWYSVQYTIDFKPSGSSTNDKLTVTITDETTGETKSSVTSYTRNTDYGVHNHTFELVADTSFELDDFKMYQKDGGVNSEFEGSAPSQPDTPTPTIPTPVVTLVKPNANGTVEEGATIELEASAAISNDTIAKIEFFEEGNSTPLSTVTSPANGMATYTVTNPSVGAHTYFAKATGTLGGTAQSAKRTITVRTAGSTEPVTNDYMMADVNFNGMSSLPSEWKTQNGASAVVAGDKLTVSGESGGRLRFDNPFVKKNVVTTVEYRIRPYGDMFVWMVNPSNSGINPTLIRFSDNKVQSIDKRYSSGNEKTKDLVAFTPGHWYSVKYTIDFKPSGSATNDKLIVTITDETTGETKSSVASYTRNTDYGVHNHTFELMSDTSFELDDFKMYQKDGGINSEFGGSTPSQPDTPTPPVNPTVPTPVISLVRPSANGTVEEGTSIELEANVSISNDTIAKVEFFEEGNSTPLSTVTSPANGVATYTVINPSLGNHTYYAKATGTLGGTAQSVKRTITVTEETLDLEPGVQVPGEPTTDYVMYDTDFEDMQDLPSVWKLTGGATTAIENGIVTVSGSSGAALRLNNPDPVTKVVTTVQYRIRPNGEMFVWMVHPTNSGINPTLLTFAGDMVQSIDKRYSSSTEKTKDLVSFVPGHWYSVSYKIDFRASGSSGNDKLTVTITDEDTGETKSSVATYTRNTDFAVFNQIFELTSDSSFELDSFRMGRVGIANTIPVVEWISPRYDSEAITGGMEIEVKAEDAEKNLTKIEFFMDDEKIGEVAASGLKDGIASIVTGELPEGTHIFKARATDTASAYSETSDIVIHIVPGEIRPVIEWISPADGAEVAIGSNLQLVIDVTVPVGDIDKVDFYHNGRFTGTVPAYDITADRAIYTVRSMASGSHSFYAIAYDVAGNSTQSAEVGVVATATANSLPIIQWKSPANNSTAVAGSALSLNITASDPDNNLEKIEFYQNNVLIKTVKAEDMTSDAVSVLTGVLSADTYNFYAKAYDIAGLSAQTDVVTVNVRTVNPGDTVEYVKLNETFDDRSGFPFVGWSGSGRLVSHNGGKALSITGSADTSAQLDISDPFASAKAYIEFDIKATGGMELWMYSTQNSSINPILLQFTAPTRDQDGRITKNGQIQAINRRYTSNSNVPVYIMDYDDLTWYHVLMSIDFRASGSTTRDLLTVEVTNLTTGEKAATSGTVYTRNTNYAVHNQIFKLTEGGYGVEIDNFKYYKMSVAVGLEDVVAVDDTGKRRTDNNNITSITDKFELVFSDAVDETSLKTIHLTTDDGKDIPFELSYDSSQNTCVITPVAYRFNVGHNYSLRLDGVTNVDGMEIGKIIMPVKATTLTGMTLSGTASVSAGTATGTLSVNNEGAARACYVIVTVTNADGTEIVRSVAKEVTLVSGNNSIPYSVDMQGAPSVARVTAVVWDKQMLWTLSNEHLLLSL